MPPRPSANEPDEYSYPRSSTEENGLSRSTSSEEVESLRGIQNIDTQSRRRLSRANTSHHERRQQAKSTKDESDSEVGIDEEKYLKAYRENLSEQIRRDPMGLTLVPYADEDFAPLTSRAYPAQPLGRPLIDFIRNEWRHTTSDNSVPGTPTCEQVIIAPKFRRYFCTFFLLLSLFLMNWIWWLGPTLRENSALNKSVILARIRPGQGVFGSNMRAEFRDMIQLKTIDEKLIPTKGGRRRLIVIGDVHGCRDECAFYCNQYFRQRECKSNCLPFSQKHFADKYFGYIVVVALLSEIGYDKHNDHIILAGDIVSKGPYSPEVVDLAISMSASCVRGNHEDRVLLARQNLHSSTLTHHHQSNKQSTDHEILRRAAPPSADTAGKSKKKKDKKDDSDNSDHYSQVDKDLACSLSKHQINYLASCPVILNLGPIPTLGNVQVVHAGLVPGIPLHLQDPISTMYMRTIDLDTHIPSHLHEGVPWYKLWERHQDAKVKKKKGGGKGEEPGTVIYGHDSRRGLQLRRWTKGLDTGCVKGGRLTALIIQDGDGSWGRKKAKKEGIQLLVKSVRCKNYRRERKNKE